MKQTLEDFISDDPVLFICPYCQRPNFIAGSRDGSDTLWGLESCPQCKAAYRGLFGRQDDIRCSPSWLVERVAMEIWSSITHSEDRSPLSLPLVNESTEPLSAAPFEKYREKRSGIPLDLIYWIAVAAASGAIGNLAYDALKTIVRFATKQKWCPNPTTVLRTKDSDEKEVVITQEQADIVLFNAFKYSKKRLAIAATEIRESKESASREAAIARLNPYVKGYLGLEGGIQPLEVHVVKTNEEKTPKRVKVKGKKRTPRRG
jgi:glutaredoxin